jgi:RNA polymerase sigma-70 factor (ECF subfamily)
LVRACARCDDKQVLCFDRPRSTHTTIVPAFRARHQERISPRDEPAQLAPPLDDAALRTRLQQADAWAQEALYRKYAQSLWGLALRLLGDRAEAEAVVAHTFSEVLRAAVPPRDLRAWLMRLALGAIQRRLRRRALLRRLGLAQAGSAEWFEQQAAQTLGPAAAGEYRQLAQLLETMPVRWRVVWCLRYVEGCTLEEVAAFSGCPFASAVREIRAAHAVISAQIELEDSER